MIVGVNGRMGAGKNTIAEMIAPIFNLKLVGFADEVKIQYAANIGLPIPQDIKSRQLVIDAVNHLKNKDASHRQGLINLSESEKEKNPYIWVDKLLNTYSDNICIYDLRFMVEIERVKPLNASLIRINRDKELRAINCVLSNENHYGECGLDDYQGWDFIVENNGTKEELKEKADVIATYLKNKYKQG